MFANWRHQPKVNNISTILSDTRLKPFPQFLHPNPRENPAAPPMSSSNLKQCPCHSWVFLPPNTVADKFSRLQIPTDSLYRTRCNGLGLAFGSGKASSQDTPLLASRPLLTTTSGWESSWFFKAPLKGCFLQ